MSGGEIEYAVREKGFLFGVDENVTACKTVRMDVAGGM